MKIKSDLVLRKYLKFLILKRY